MNRLMTFDKYRVFETEFAGRPLKVETGKMTQLANGACLVHYGDTTVHVAVTASEKPREGVDFFPLSVDYEEKMYAVGKIPGSYLKRGQTFGKGYPHKPCNRPSYPSSF